MNGAPALASSQPAAGVAVGACRVLAGSSSWADRSLVRDGSFYPSRSLSASERLAHYASRLPLAEVATTYRFPPTPEVARRWVAMTPPGFTMDIRAWSLLSGAPTWPESLWPDLQRYVTPPRRETTKLYRHHLPREAVDECWARFNHAIAPLGQAGRLGVVIVRFPSWFSPRPAAWEELACLPARLAGLKVAVELSNPHWFDRDACEQTLATLEELGLCFVCQDKPASTKPIVAATGDIALVRFPGRTAHAWDAARAAGTAGPDLDQLAWWSYRYSDEELAAWVPAVRELASGTSQVHLIMDNCWRADAVDNATALLELVARG